MHAEQDVWRDLLACDSFSAILSTKKICIVKLHILITNIQKLIESNEN